MNSSETTASWALNSLTRSALMTPAKKRSIRAMCAPLRSELFALAALGLVAAGCRESPVATPRERAATAAPSSVSAVVSSAASPAATAPSATISATNSAAIPPPKSAFAGPSLVVAGDLVERSSLAVQATLTTDRVVASSLSEGMAYLVVRGPSQLELRAFSTADGSRRWSSPVSQCLQPVASASGVFCGTSLGVLQLSREDGTARTVGTPMPVTSMVSLGERVVVLSNAQAVQVLSAETGAQLGRLELPEQPVSGILRSPLLRAGTLACGVSPNDKTTLLMCVDNTPKLVRRAVLNVPQGTLRQADEKLLVVSSWREDPAACEVVSTSSGATLARAPSACAAAFPQGNAASLLTVEPKLRLLDAKGVIQWEQPGSWHNAARALQSGSQLIIAGYNPIATGTSLFAVDAATGKPAWTAKVDSLPIEHSKYSNQVELELTEHGLLLLGHEASQDFAQLFDVTSGKRLASVVRGH